MILDTNFLSEYHDEHAAGRVGRTRRFMASHRNRPIWTTVISAAEIAVIFDNTEDARRFLGRFFLLKNVFPELAYTAAAIDRELIALGRRLGENDNWIAAFCRYYGEPLVSNDSAFERVRGLRRVAY